MSQRVMSEAGTYDNLIIDTILHPSDFSEASEAAFAHALKTALVAHSRLTLLHVTSDRTPGWWTDFPGVRRTLERWGLLPPNSPQSAVPAPGDKPHFRRARTRHRRGEEPQAWPRPRGLSAPLPRDAPDRSDRAGAAS